MEGFKAKDEDGVDVVYPFGIFGKGYRLPDANAKQRLEQVDAKAIRILGACMFAVLIVLLIVGYAPHNTPEIVWLRYGLAVIGDYVPMDLAPGMAMFLPALAYSIIGRRAAVRTLEPARKQLTAGERLSRHSRLGRIRWVRISTAGLALSAILAMVILIPVLSAPPVNPETRAMAWTFVAGMLALFVVFAILVRWSSRKATDLHNPPANDRQEPRDS